MHSLGALNAVFYIEYSQTILSLYFVNKSKNVYNKNFRFYTNSQHFCMSPFLSTLLLLFIYLLDHQSFNFMLLWKSLSTENADKTVEWNVDYQMYSYLGICLEALSESAKTRSEDSRSPDWDLNPGSLEYEGVLLTRARLAVSLNLFFARCTLRLGGQYSKVYVKIFCSGTGYSH